VESGIDRQNNNIGNAPNRKQSGKPAKRGLSNISTFAI
jgi:hypothetical protein